MPELRGGYTTGTCAAAAAKAAVLALSGPGTRDGREVEIGLPEGGRVRIPIHAVHCTGSSATASVRKDAGDDPDVTHGVFVTVTVSWRTDQEIRLAAGEGIGTVTKAGLAVLPGEPAINPVPRRMILQAVREVTDRGVDATVAIPGGERLAVKTFNPRLGIVGGLSILGTSGRVRPFSCPALRTSLLCLLDVASACGVRAPVLVPGHIGRRAALGHFNVEAGQIIEVGNEWGFMLDKAAQRGFKTLLVLGHPGKLAKLAAGDWDTHSARAKSAVSFLAALAASLEGRPLPEAATVEGLFSALPGEKRRRLGDALAERVREAVGGRLGGGVAVAVVLVNLAGEKLGWAGDLKDWQ